MMPSLIGLTPRQLLDLRREHDWSANPTQEIETWRIELYHLITNVFVARNIKTMEIA